MLAPGPESLIAGDMGDVYLKLERSAALERYPVSSRLVLCTANTANLSWTTSQPFCKPSSWPASSLSGAEVELPKASQAK